MPARPSITMTRPLPVAALSSASRCGPARRRARGSARPSSYVGPGELTQGSYVRAWPHRVEFEQRGELVDGVGSSCAQPHDLAAVGAQQAAVPVGGDGVHRAAEGPRVRRVRRAGRSRGGGRRRARRRTAAPPPARRPPRPRAARGQQVSCSPGCTSTSRVGIATVRSPVQSGAGELGAREPRLEPARAAGPSPITTSRMPGTVRELGEAAYAVALVQSADVADDDLRALRRAGPRPRVVQPLVAQRRREGRSVDAGAHSPASTPNSASR